MFFDNSLYFSQAQAITATANSTSIYDVTGAGSGNAPSLSFGNASTFGDDMGIGDGVAIPYLIVNIGTAFATANSGTLQVSLQEAPDNGSNAPGTYTTIYSSAVFAASALTANTQLLMVQVPPRPAGTALPRFYRVVYTVATGSFSAGTVTAALAINPPSLNGQYPTYGQYPANFTVAS